MAAMTTPQESIRIFHPIPSAKLIVLVFDLDGTLADTTTDLCNSVNASLHRFSLESLPNSTIAGFVGNGAPTLMRRSLARALRTPPEEVTDALLQPFYSAFLEYYIEHELDNTQLYPGAFESQRVLQQQAKEGRWTMAVLTNKPERLAKEIVERLGIAPYFTRIYGGDSLPTRKPDPQALFSLAEQTGAQPDEIVMTGDSKVDVMTARNVGAWSLGCAFGFGPRNIMETAPDTLVTSAVDWATVLMPISLFH
jgi:phosphoglycolate phosphatase